MSAAARPDPTGVVGIIANPLAGKDIRRLVAEASPVSDMAKVGIVRRVVIGAVEAGAAKVVLADDRRGLALRAIDKLQFPGDVELMLLDEPIIDSGANSQRAALRCRNEGAGAVVALGGDGTQRDVAKGWPGLPLVSLSTGTNNVFPRQVEATVAGYAAGLVASGRVPLAEAATEMKQIVVDIDGVEKPDMGLVDVALLSSRFTASRAVWDPSTLTELVACIAEPSAVGLSSIAGLLAPTNRAEPGGVHVSFGETASSKVTRAPIAPGLYTDVSVRSVRRLANDEEVEVVGPGTLSFDGERDVALAVGQRARLRVTAGGPNVIDVDRALLASTSTPTMEAK